MENCLSLFSLCTKDRSLKFIDFELEPPDLFFFRKLRFREALDLLISLGLKPFDFSSGRLISFSPHVDLLLQSLVLDGEILQVPGLLFVVLTKPSHLTLHLPQCFRVVESLLGEL